MRRLHGRLAAQRGWRADVVAAVFGVIAALALPPAFLLPALFFAVPGLLVLIGAAPGPAVAFRRGFWFGFGHHVAGLYWITEAILLEAGQYWWLVPIAVPGLAAILALFIAAPCAIARRFPAGLPRVLALAGGWVLFDLARQFVATGFPWNPWGSVWAFPGRLGDIFLQPAAWVGTPGLTALTVLLAGLPLLGRRGVVACAAGIALWAGLGFARLAAPAQPAPGFDAVLVQGNVPEGHKLDRSFVDEVWRRYLALTAEGVADTRGPAVVVWPETASVYPLTEVPAARAAIAEAAGGNPALVGSVRWGADGRPRNSLIALTGKGAIAAIYDKWHLVPGGEFAPSWVPFGVQLVPGGGFDAGPGPQTLRVPGLPPFGPLICYEAIFPGEVVDEAHRPAWMVNITNDAWFGSSSGPHQHFAAARMRAVEEGLPLVRAANTGISAVFDAHGHVMARLPIGVAGVLVVPLPGSLPPTVFGRLGLALPAGLGCILLLGGIAACALRRRNLRISSRN